MEHLKGSGTMNFLEVRDNTVIDYIIVKEKVYNKVDFKVEKKMDIDLLSLGLRLERKEEENSEKEEEEEEENRGGKMKEIIIRKRR